MLDICNVMQSNEIHTHVMQQCARGVADLRSDWWTPSARLDTLLAIKNGCS